MVIDYILDRKDGYGYDVKEFYDACMAYEEFDIARALDSGTEKDVKKALCDYVIYNDYPKSICKYINSENWLDDDYYESKKSVHKSLKESSKILAKNKKGKVVGYIEPQKDGSFGYAFGSPSQKEVIMFYVDTLEQAKDRIAEHSYDDVIFESKKSARKSLKEEKATDSLFEDVVFSMIKKFKLKKEYDVERPSWTVFNFRHKNKDAQFAITFDERGHGDFLYGEVLAFGDEKDDIFKYKTDEVKVDSYNIEKECSNIIADCLAFIDANKKITIFESKKSVKRSLKEGFNDELIATSYDGETTLYLSDERQANHGKDPHYEFKLGENGYFTRYIRCDDNRCENVVLDWIKEFDLDISKSEISKIIKLHESKKSARKNSLKEEAMTTKLFRFVQDLYDLHYITEEQLNKFQTHDFSKKEIKVLEHNYEIYKTSNEFDEINNAIKLTVNMINSFTESLKEYLVKGLDVDFVVDHFLSLEDPNNFDLINELDDLWKLYKKSWNKFNKSLSDFWKVMKDIKKLDSFDKTCKEIIDAWYDDIEKIFYSDDNLENLKLNYGFEGNDVF